MPAKKCFIFKEKTTPEQNEEDIERLDNEIKEASKKRNYAQAQKLQQQLDYCRRVKEYFDYQKLEGTTERELEKVEQDRLSEEEDIRSRMGQKATEIVQDAEQRLQQLEAKHQEEMEAIDQRFSDPRFSACRMSSIIATMLKSEDYYARQRNFQVADAYKSQIAARAQKEIIDTETNADQTVNAAIEAALRRYDTERKGFHNHLSNQKLLLQKETERQLLVVRNRFSKLRHQVVGLTASDQLPDIPKHEAHVYEILDIEFADILLRTESIFAVSPPPSPGNSARATSRRSQTMTTNEDLSSTVRNPRVSRALESTINKNLAQTL